MNQHGERSDAADPPTTRRRTLTTRSTTDHTSTIDIQCVAKRHIAEIAATSRHANDAAARGNGSSAARRRLRAEWRRHVEESDVETRQPATGAANPMNSPAGVVHVCRVAEMQTRLQSLERRRPPVSPVPESEAEADIEMRGAWIRSLAANAVSSTYRTSTVAVAATSSRQATAVSNLIIR